jgi:hypothetical protein
MLAPIELPEEMNTIPDHFNTVLSRAVKDGGGNDGIQFMEGLTVSKGKSELVISEIEGLPQFYLQKIQVDLLQGAAMSDVTVFAVSDNMVYFHDPGHCTIRCASAIIPGAVKRENIITFQEKTLAAAEILYSGIMHETVATVLKRVLTFGTVDADMGIAVKVIFDPELHIVKLIGENNEGEFEEVTAMEYEGDKPLNLLISSSSLNELSGRPFTIKQRPDKPNGVWFIAQEGITTYICGGTKE